MVNNNSHAFIVLRAIRATRVTVLIIALLALAPRTFIVPMILQSARALARLAVRMTRTVLKVQTQQH